MFRKTQRALRMGVVVLLAMAGSNAGSAQVRRQQNEPPAQGDGDVGHTLTAQVVRTGLYLISGGGANSLLRFSANGLILVDGKLPGNYRALMSQVRNISKISDLPVRFLIVTDHHQNHTGNNAQFVAAGVRIIANENVTHNLTINNSPGNRAASPNITFDHDYTLRLGGIEAQLMHFGNAHTSGDTVVLFANLKVVAVGDLFAPTPDPDFAAGGSLVGWGSVLAKILKLDFDVVVPGTGPTVTRAELAAFKTKVDILVSRATALVKKGIPKDQLMAHLKTDDLGWKFNITGDRLDRFYAELSRTK